MHLISSSDIWSEFTKFSAVKSYEFAILLLSDHSKLRDESLIADFPFVQSFYAYFACTSHCQCETKEVRNNL